VSTANSLNRVPTSTNSLLQMYPHDNVALLQSISEVLYCDFVASCSIESGISVCKCPEGYTGSGTQCLGKVAFACSSVAENYFTVILEIFTVPTACLCFSVFPYGFADNIQVCCSWIYTKNYV